MSRKRKHKHQFTLFYTNFGPFGRQDVHVHPCVDDVCDEVMIGHGRHCGGVKKQAHVRETLSDEP